MSESTVVSSTEASPDPTPPAEPAPPAERPKLTAEDFFPETILPPRDRVSDALPTLNEIQRFKFLHKIPLKERTATLYLLLRVLLSFAELAAAFATESEAKIDARSVRLQLVAELAPAKTLARLVLLVRSKLPSRDTLIRAHGPDDIAMLVTPLLTALSRLSFVPVTAGFFSALNQRPDMRISAAIFFSTEELDADQELRLRTVRAWNAFLAPADWSLVPIAPGTSNKRAKWVPRADAPTAF